MVTLNQISTASLINRLIYSYYSGKQNLSIKEQEKKSSYEALVKYNVTNYGQLKDLIESGNLEFQIEYLIEALKQAEIALISASGIAPVYENFYCNGSKISEETMMQTDMDTNADVLILGNILKKNFNQKDILKHYSIYFIKQMLSNYSIGSLGRIENAYVHNSKFFGESSPEKIISAINLYEQQVVRQAIKYPWCKNVGVFSIDKDYKLQATEEQISEIMRYLIDSTSECIWGPLTEKQKLLFEKAIKGVKTREGIIVRDNLIDVISNYTTLGELEEGIVRTRTINKFIKKNS